MTNIDEVKQIDGEMLSLEDACKKYHRLIGSIASKLLKTSYRFGLDLNDLISFGIEGLIKAYRRFDETKGFKFMTYAYPLIRGEMQRRIRDYGGTVKFSRSDRELANQIYGSNIQNRSVSEICKETKRKTSEVLSALAILNGPMVSLEKKIFDDSDNITKTIGDKLGKMADFSTVEVNDFLSTLPENLRTIVRMRMNDKHQAEIGQAIGCSQVHISRQISKIQELYKQYIEGGLNHERA